MQFISAELQEVKSWVACLKVYVSITCICSELRVQEFFPQIVMGKDKSFIFVTSIRKKIQHLEHIHIKFYMDM